MNTGASPLEMISELYTRSARERVLHSGFVHRHFRGPCRDVLVSKRCICVDDLSYLALVFLRVGSPFPNPRVLPQLHNGAYCVRERRQSREFTTLSFSDNAHPFESCGLVIRTDMLVRAQLSYNRGSTLLAD